LELFKEFAESVSDTQPPFPTRIVFPLLSRKWNSGYCRQTTRQICSCWTTSYWDQQSEILLSV